MSECTRIADQFRRMIQGDAWHGPSVAEALRGVTADQAGLRPVPGAHSMFELVHHMGAWIAEVTQRLQGRSAREPDDGDFPPAGVTVDADAWAGVQRRLDDRAGALLAALAAFDDRRLDDRVGDERNSPLGTGVTYYGTLHGVIEHTAYHVGQLILLRKAIGAP